MNDTAFRKAHVGAAEVAALFDCHPNLTRFELWHRKAGNIPEPDFAGNERALWGTVLEPAIIAEACRRWGYELDETPEHLSNGRGLGGHPDAFVRDARGPGVLEIKTVDWLQVKKWGDEPPLNYQLQPQSYAGLGERTWCDLITLVGGNDLRRWQDEFRPRLFASIESRVDDFWTSVRAGQEPRPDFGADLDAIMAVAGCGDIGGVVDLSRDNRAGAAAAEYLAAKADEKDAKGRAEALKAELMHKVGSADIALLPGFNVAAHMTAGSVGTLITADHVGTHVGGRRGYRRFDIRESLDG